MIFSIESEQGGQIIGRKGSTLRNIQALMEETSTKAGYDWTFSLQVAGGEEKRRRSRNMIDVTIVVMVVVMVVAIIEEAIEMMTI